MKILYKICLVLTFFSCNQSQEKSPKNNFIKNPSLSENEKMEAIYYSIPSPMETTIILKRSYSKFSSQLLFPSYNISEVYENQTRALLLGIISTDLNYAMLCERRMETNQLINQVIEIAQLLHLDAVVNSKIKQRIEDNLNNKDSMQIIIGNTFWEIENKLKNDEKDELSALIVAGGWIEGLYLATSMSALDPKNKSLKNIIAEQKIVHENLLSLIKDYDFKEIIEDNFIVSINSLETVFNKILRTEIEENTPLIAEKNKEIVIGNYFNLKFEEKDLDDIHILISKIRQKILTQLL
tara:strand:- start:57069 stop:57956 length:888 start_codon:yes stop_codon:yes gene_type:complete